jgi:hypothetical protein
MHTEAGLNWQQQIHTWLAGQRWLVGVHAEEVVEFFRCAFEHTRSPAHAWFGTHQGTASLVVGGIFLAAFHRRSDERGVWLLTDNPQAVIPGLRLSPVRSTRKGDQPLTWAHLWPLDNLDQLLKSAALWFAFAEASERILSYPIGQGREELLRRRGKRRLSEFWRDDLLATSSGLEALPPGATGSVPDLDLEYGAAREGRQVWVAHLQRERDAALAHRKKAHVRRTLGELACEVCGLRFDDLPAGLGEACCEVHHARPLGEANEEVETSLADLHVLCANCHRMLHRTWPLKSVPEMQQLLARKA